VVIEASSTSGARSVSRSSVITSSTARTTVSGRAVAAEATASSRHRAAESMLVCRMEDSAAASWGRRGSGDDERYSGLGVQLPCSGQEGAEEGADVAGRPARVYAS